jgi:hypothetical protein
MPSHEEHIRGTLGESGEPLFVSDITERLNAELVSGPAFDTTEVVKHLQSSYDHVIQLGDERWTLKRLVRTQAAGRRGKRKRKVGSKAREPVTVAEAADRQFSEAGF